MPFTTAASQLDPAVLADLRRRNHWRLLRVIWPFLLAVPLLLAMVVFSFRLMAAGRAYTEGESLWSKGQKDAVQFLARYHESCDPADLERYRRAIAVPLGDRQARLAMLLPEPDLAAARAGFLQGGNHPDEVDGMIFLFLHFRQLPLLREVVQIWADAEVHLMALTAAAEHMQARAATVCGAAGHDDATMQAVYRINDVLTPLQREFSDRLGRANRTIQAVLLGLMATAALLLTLAGVALSRRVVLRASLAEAITRDELRQRRESLQRLREVLHTLTGGSASVGIDPASRDDMQAVTRSVSQLAAQEHATNARLHTILSLSPDAFVSFDGQDRVTDVSPAFARITGLDPAEVLGRLEPEVRARLNALFQSGHLLPEPARLRERETPLALPLAGPGHRVLTAELREAEVAAEAGDEDNDPQGIRRVLCLRDVSREHEIDRLKSEFLTLAAHELRTPMASIHGFVELLLHRRYDDARRLDMLGIVHRKSQLMIGIVDDLLDLSRLESRQELDLQRQPLDLRELLSRVLAEFTLPEGRDAPQLLSAAPAEPAADDVPEGLPAPVLADPHKLTRVITNLLTNAYKFSPPGTAVALRLRHAAGRVGIEVRDHGIGMSPEQLARLGERFYRADASGNIPGTGLGVSIVREILSLHDGGLEARSTPGEGSVFTAWLPRQNPSEPAPEPPPEPA
ncbi:sensor histidine kinase [Leptothrix discophora]|uniref:histidine kinase n=1 Tax=Leptothrix discophora TaxID=89 RepID=A0ABT9G5V4_LEPDI|nr:ATP-binding protein [Leptothrix discophora]MDP4301866.1 ATP-binding protein [Leptothrix discophora]